MLEFPRYIALRRNEVKGIVPGASKLNKWMAGETPEPLWADGDDETTGRTQRQTMALKNVRYRITARIEPRAAFRFDLGGMNAQFERRAKHGKCFQQPYFGCREFPAFFEYLPKDAPRRSAIPLDQHLGFMVYDVFDLAGEETSDSAKPFITAFDAHIRKGRLDIPAFGSEQVHKPARA